MCGHTPEVRTRTFYPSRPTITGGGINFFSEDDVPKDSFLLSGSSRRISKMRFFANYSMEGYKSRKDGWEGYIQAGNYNA